MQTNNWGWLKLIAIGRILSALTFFMYVGSIQQLISVWKLSATEAGLIQTSLVIGFAFALFISSYCSDFYNPNRILSIYLVINFLYLIKALILFQYEEPNLKLYLNNPIHYHTMILI